jgi:hypothetical protein
MVKLVASILTALMIMALLAGCSAPPPEPVAVQPAPTQASLPSTIPPPTGGEVYPSAEPTGSVEITPSATDIPEAPPVCPADPVKELFDNSEAHRMAPVLLATDADRLFAGDARAALEVTSEATRLLVDMHRSRAIKDGTVIVPEYVNVQDVKTYIQGIWGIQTLEFDVQNYREGINMSGEDTILISVEAREGGGRETRITKNSSLGRLPDGNFFVFGNMLIPADRNGDGVYEFYTLPGQFLDGTNAGFFKVPGCDAVIARFDENGNIVAIMRKGADIIDINRLWTTRAGEAVQVAEPLGEPVGDFEYKFLIMKNTKGDGLLETFRQPLEYKFIGGNDSPAAKHMAVIDMAITKKEITPDGRPRIEVGFIWNNGEEDRLLSYPVELIGSKRDPSEIGEYNLSMLYYPYGYEGGGFICGLVYGAHPISKFYNLLEVGEVVGVKIPLEWQEDPPKGFEFWGPWFYPARDRVRELEPVQREFVDFVTTGEGQPPDPENFDILVKGLEVAAKNGCKP